MKHYKVGIIKDGYIFFLGKKKTLDEAGFKFSFFRGYDAGTPFTDKKQAYSSLMSTLGEHKGIIVFIMDMTAFSYDFTKMTDLTQQLK